MINSSIFMHPATFFIIGAILLPLVKRVHISLQKVILVVVPVLAIIQVNMALPESFGLVNYLGFDLIFGRVDKLALIFLNVFTIMALIGSVYGLHVNESGQHIAGWLYVAGSLGVTLCGDYLTLFVFWELMAFASTFLIWYRKKKKSIEAGFRYLLVHTAGGLVLLAGIFLRYKNVGMEGMAFEHIAANGVTTADYLIMIGFMLNAAVPPIHAWLPDAYPEATVTGAVFMCAFTTKTAVYVLARGFAGYEVLAIMGAIMTLYGVGYAIVESDARRILAYHIVSQVGYMVCGIGIGTAMAVNGACAHAYAHILYKALLFMGVGAVLEMTGKSRLTELGGLYAKMPWALVFTVIGGIAISGFPFTSGFISKSMIIAAAGEHHQIGIMILLTLAAVGTFLSVGIKLPYFIWFGGKKTSDIECKDAPWNMNLGMLMAAFFCIALGFKNGIFGYFGYDWLYAMLPNPVDYHPYTSYHLSETFQLLGFTGFGFFLLHKYLTPKPYMCLDLDWFYRKGARVFMWLALKPVTAVNNFTDNVWKSIGLAFTMATAKMFSWFDKEGIDWVIDGSAKSVVNGGDQIRHIETGKIQQYIGFAVAMIFIVLIAVIFNF